MSSMKKKESTSLIIDSHCHLEEFYRNGTLPQVLERAKKVGVDEMIVIGTNLKDWDLYAQLSNDYGGNIYYSVGLHPENVDEDWEAYVQQLGSYFALENSPIALGEIGLDFYRLPEDVTQADKIKEWQEAAFRYQLYLAMQLGCPVIIHSRNAFKECVKIVDESKVDWNKVVFHCFVEGVDEIKELNKRGGRASFTGIITYKNAPKVREAALAQGLEKLMLETDCPYLAPEPFRGKENEPAYMFQIIEYAANIFNYDREEFLKRVRNNTITFFDLPV